MKHEKLSQTLDDQLIFDGLARLAVGASMKECVQDATGKVSDLTAEEACAWWEMLAAESAKHSEITLE